MLLHSFKFKKHLEKKFSEDFNSIDIDQDINDLFADVNDFIDVDTHVKLLSMIDMIDFDNFQRFFYICLRHCKNSTVVSQDIEHIRGNLILQFLCLICIEFYFS